MPAASPHESWKLLATSYCLPETRRAPPLFCHTHTNVNNAFSELSVSVQASVSLTVSVQSDPHKSPAAHLQNVRLARRIQRRAGDRSSFFFLSNTNAHRPTSCLCRDSLLDPCHASTPHPQRAHTALKHQIIL